MVEFKFVVCGDRRVLELLCICPASELIAKMVEMYVAIWFDLFNLVDNLYLPSQLTVKHIFV